MLRVVEIVRRTLEGSVLAMLLIGVVALFDVSETVNLLLAESSAQSILFLLVIAIVLADLIAKLIGIFGSTFPDLVPKLDEGDLKRASLINRLRPGQTLALLSGAYAARIFLFVLIFALLGASYAFAPAQAQEKLFGDLSALDATVSFMREGIAGSVGYFLFFLGPDTLKPITTFIVSEPLAPASVDGDILMAGIRLYGFAFVLALLRTLVTPITYVRARLRANKISEKTELDVTSDALESAQA